jgi:prepilin-type N-terminal cleavage/methylation domain-containing protein
MNKQRGWTWFETLIVLAILGILAAVIVPNIKNFTREHKIEITSDTTSVDRTIKGTIIAIDQKADDSTLHFSGGVEIQVTNKSLDNFNIQLNQPMTYDFHYNFTNFDLIRIYRSVNETH